MQYILHTFASCTQAHTHGDTHTHGKHLKIANTRKRISTDSQDGGAVRQTQQEGESKKRKICHVACETTTPEMEFSPAAPTCIRHRSTRTPLHCKHIPSEPFAFVQYLCARSHPIDCLRVQKGTSSPFHPQKCGDHYCVMWM